MKVKASELKGSNGCHRKKAKRRIEITLEKNERYKKTVIAKIAIRDYLSEPKVLHSLEEVEEFIKKEMDKLTYSSEQQRLTETEELIKIVVRYLKYEKRQMSTNIKKSIKCLGNEIEVSPDLVFKGEKQDSKGNVYPYVEVILVKNSKPALSRRGRKQETNLDKNIEINAALELAREYMEESNQVGLVGAGIYYLKKDKDGDISEEFETGKQKAYIEDVYIPGETSIRTLSLEQEFKKFMDGEACTKGMCDKCEFNAICNYISPPVKVQEEKKPFSIEGINLSKEQEQAINVMNGYVRINAGAGCGKTLVVSMRVAKLLMNGTKPEKIILTTFTNAGVDELRTRIKFLVDAYGIDCDLEKLTIITLNGFGSRLMSMYYKELGYSNPPFLADVVDKIDILLKLLKGEGIYEGLDYKNIFMNSKNHKGAIPYILQQFSIMENSMIDSFEEYVQIAAVSEGMTETARKIFELYTEYRNEMKRLSLIDYSDQDKAVFEILKIDPFLFDNKFSFEHIIVDEFQDCSEVQINLIKEMCSSNFFKSLMVVGDDSQGATCSATSL